jgi:hypothetical protein
VKTQAVVGALLLCLLSPSNSSADLRFFSPNTYREDVAALAKLVKGLPCADDLSQFESDARGANDIAALEAIHAEAVETVIQCLLRQEGEFARLHAEYRDFQVLRLPGYLVRALTSGGFGLKTLEGRWEGRWYGGEPWLNGDATLTLRLDPDGESIAGSFARSGPHEGETEFRMSGTFDGERLVFRSDERIIVFTFHGRFGWLKALRGEYEVLAGRAAGERGAYELIKKR